MNTIGKPPVRYWTSFQVNNMNRYGLLNIIEDNGWEELIGEGKSLDAWDDINMSQIRDIINTKMHEYIQEVNARSSQNLFNKQDR